MAVFPGRKTRVSEMTNVNSELDDPVEHQGHGFTTFGGRQAVTEAGLN